MTNLFTDLQENIAGRLQADIWLAAPPAVKISTEREGDMASAIDRDLKGNGVGVVVFTPQITRGEIDGASVLDVVVVVGVAERPLVNRGPTGTGKPGTDIATSIMALLWDYRPSDVWQPLSFSSRVLEDSTPDLVAYSLRFDTSIRVEPVDQRETVEA